MARKHNSHHVAADAGAGFFDVRDRERQLAFENLCANALAFGASSVLNGAYAFFEFFVGAQQCPQK